MLAGLLIRPGVPSDAVATRRLLVETWHDTYDALLGPERVMHITDEWHAVDVLARQVGLAATSFLVAEQDGGIIGHAFARELPGGVLVLARLYVLPSWQRHAVGTLLLQAAIARHPGSASLQLDVEAGNAKAVAFYRQHGFATVEG